jgi:putative acetyltransferase
MGTVMLDVHIRPFQSGDEEAFRSLNEAWITRNFGKLEAPDRIVLDNPVLEILGPGGQIFIATIDDTPVGCCGLIPMEGGCFELAQGCFEVVKMTVLESCRGQGVGRQVLEHTIAEARRLGAVRLYLETNKKLTSAIHLYESVGFYHLPPERVHASPYARANVFMEMLL